MDGSKSNPAVSAVGPVSNARDKTENQAKQYGTIQESTVASNHAHGGDRRGQTEDQPTANAMSCRVR